MVTTSWTLDSVYVREDEPDGQNKVSLRTTDAEAYYLARRLCSRKGQRSGQRGTRAVMLDFDGSEGIVTLENTSCQQRTMIGSLAKGEPVEVMLDFELPSSPGIMTETNL